MRTSNNTARKVDETNHTSGSADFDHSHAIKAIRDFANSPAMKVLRDYVNSPEIKKMAAGAGPIAGDKR